MTCKLLEDLLARTPSSPALAELPRRLAVSGESGTLLRRLPDAELKGKVRGKGGGVDDVSTLDGLVATTEGRGELSFAVLVNWDDDAVAVGIQKRLIAQILRYPAITVAPAGA